MIDLDWAKWSTINKHGVIQFWEDKPLFNDGIWKNPLSPWLKKDFRVESIYFVRTPTPVNVEATLRPVNNPYLNAPMEMWDYEWDKILGEYEEEDLEGEEKIAAWNKLEHIKPYDSAGSLHIGENMYELDGVDYSVKWVYGQDSAIPAMISMRTPRKRRGPIQYDLFEEDDG